MNVTGRFVIAKQFKGKTGNTLTMYDLEAGCEVRVGCQQEFDAKDLQVPLTLNIKGFTVKRSSKDGSLYFTAEAIAAAKQP